MREQVLALTPPERHWHVLCALDDLAAEGRPVNCHRIKKSVERQTGRDKLIKKLKWASEPMPPEYEWLARVYLRCIGQAIIDMDTPAEVSDKSGTKRQRAKRARYRLRRMRDRERAIAYLESDMFDLHCDVLGLNPDWAFEQIQKWYRAEILHVG